MTAEPASAASPILQLTQMRFGYAGGAGFDLSVPRFELARGETVLILGDSGSGKSTLLSLICGTLVAQAGRVALSGTDLGGLRGPARDRFRAEHLGVIFQQFNLLPFATVRDNILLPLRFAPARRARVPDAEASLRALCGALRLPDALLDARAGTLSVGQQQRVAVARALIGGPELVIADEPSSALDATSEGAFLDLLFAQTRAQGASLLLVSHDPRLGARFDRVVDMAEIATRGGQAA